MFKRVTFEEWQSIITIIAFFLTFSAFIYFSIRAIRMKRKERDHAAHLPLEDEDKDSHEKG